MKENVMLEKYKTLVTVSESQSFTEAACKLFCSQPTVTQHIQQLEHHYGYKLVKRQKRIVELTQYGEVLVEYARKILLLEENATKKLANVEAKQQILPLYISNYLANSFFNMIFSSPNHAGCGYSSFEIHSHCYSDLKNALISKEAKYALMPIYDAEEVFLKQYDVDLLFEEELFLIVSKEHRLAQRKLVYKRDIEGEQILLPPSTLFHELIKSNIEEVNASFLQMPSFPLIEKAVEQNMGIAFVPLANKTQANQNLVYKQITGLTLMRKNGIIKNREMPLNQAEIDFCTHIKKQFS